MPLNPEKFADVAVSLASGRKIDPAQEECARTAAGRAYYSAYLAVREAVRTQYGDPTFDVRHVDLTNALKRAPDKDVKAVGTHLRALLDKRTNSDYRLNATVTQADAITSAASARSIFTVLPTLAGKLPSGIPRR